MRKRNESGEISYILNYFTCSLPSLLYFDRREARDFYFFFPLFFPTQHQISIYLSQITNFFNFGLWFLFPVPFSQPAPNSKWYSDEKNQPEHHLASFFFSFFHSNKREWIEFVHRSRPVDRSKGELLWCIRIFFGNTWKIYTYHYIDILQNRCPNIVLVRRRYPSSSSDGTRFISHVLVVECTYFIYLNLMNKKKKRVRFQPRRKRALNGESHESWLQIHTFNGEENK